MAVQKAVLASHSGESLTTTVKGGGGGLPAEPHPWLSMPWAGLRGFVGKAVPGVGLRQGFFGVQYASRVPPPSL